MELGQCAGVGACMAMDEKSSVQDVPYEKLRSRLIADHAVLEWKGEPVRVESKLISIDVTEAADLKEWAQSELLPVCDTWYPKIAAMLPSDGFVAPEHVTIRFRDDMPKGVPRLYTHGARYFHAIPAGFWRNSSTAQAAGAVVHEMVHVVQHYHSARNPSWLVEGIADYVRWFKYEPETHGADVRDPALKACIYDDSYRVTANFLDFCFAGAWRESCRDPERGDARGEILGCIVEREATGKLSAGVGREKSGRRLFSHHALFKCVALR